MRFKNYLDRSNGISYKQDQQITMAQEIVIFGQRFIVNSTSSLFIFFRFFLSRCNMAKFYLIISFSLLLRRAQTEYDFPNKTKKIKWQTATTTRMKKRPKKACAMLCCVNDNVSTVLCAVICCCLSVCLVCLCGTVFTCRASQMSATWIRCCFNFQPLSPNTGCTWSLSKAISNLQRTNVIKLRPIDNTDDIKAK